MQEVGSGIYMIRADSGCMLAVMAVSGHNQNTSGLGPACVLGKFVQLRMRLKQTVVFHRGDVPCLVQLYLEEQGLMLVVSTTVKTSVLHISCILVCACACACVCVYVCVCEICPYCNMQGLNYPSDLF